MANRKKPLAILIEDDPMQLEMAKDELEGKGFDTESHASVDGFLKNYGYNEEVKKLTKLNGNSPDIVVVTDNNTNTSKRGIDVVEILNGTNIPVVLITSDHTSDGVNNHIVKEKGGNTAGFVRKNQNDTFVSLYNEINRTMAQAALNIKYGVGSAGGRSH